MHIVDVRESAHAGDHGNCNSHSAVIVEMMITLAPRMKPHSRIKVTIRMTYGFHHVSSLIALIMLRCGGLDIHLPQPRT